MGNENAASCPSGTFRAADGDINIVANDEHQYQALCDAIAAPELKTDTRFITRPLRVANREALNALLAERLSARSALEWDAVLSAAGVPAGPILCLMDAVTLPQVKARRLIKEFDGTTIGRPFSVHRLGFTLDSGIPDVALPPPQLGEHTDEILQDIGYSSDEIARLRDKAIL